MYKDIIEFFKQHQDTLNVKSYFDRLFEDEKELKDIGEIYKKNTGSTKDSSELGQRIADRARKVDLGGGDFIEITEEPSAEKNGSGKKCDTNALKKYQNSSCYKSCIEETKARRCYAKMEECYDSCRKECIEPCEQGGRYDCLEFCNGCGCSEEYKECEKKRISDLMQCLRPCCEAVGCQYHSIGDDVRENYVCKW